MFHGSLVAIVTPMTSAGDVDWSCYDKLLDFHLEKGTDGIVVAGSSGEAAMLTADEWRKLVRCTIEKVAGRIPVVVGASKSGTQATCSLAQEVMSLGADACLIMAPPYVKPTQEGLYQHFSYIAKEVPLPLILYNVPGRTASDIQLETVVRLADVPNIVAIKECTGDLGRTRDILTACGDKLDVLSGEDALNKDIILAGGNGCISVVANLFPDVMSKLCKAALDGDEAVASSLHRRLAPLIDVLFLEANPIPVKWAALRLGLIPEGIRLPLTPLSAAFHQSVEEALENVR